MFETLWTTYLYQPLFNVLIWIYNNLTPLNLGWAVVYLAILVRVVLLPFTIMEERNKIRNLRLVEAVKEIERGYKSDHILKKEEIRKVLKKRKVQPWLTVIVLGAQLLVLVLLYQVFLQGITGERVFRTLYSWVNFPGKINTVFFGFDLGTRHDIVWSGAVGVFLFLEIYLNFRINRLRVTQADLLYLILFPLFVWWLLWILPMVKSLFVLTSLLFSVLVHQFMKMTMFKKAAAH